MRIVSFGDEAEIYVRNGITDEMKRVCSERGVAYGRKFIWTNKLKTDEERVDVMKALLRLGCAYGIVVPFENHVNVPGKWFIYDDLARYLIDAGLDEHSNVALLDSRWNMLDTCSLYEAGNRANALVEISRHKDAEFCITEHGDIIFCGDVPMYISVMSTRMGCCASARVLYTSECTVIEPAELINMMGANVKVVVHADEANYNFDGDLVSPLGLVNHLVNVGVKPNRKIALYNRGKSVVTTDLSAADIVFSVMS